MNQLGLSDLSSLLAAQSSPCVSLYISAGPQGLWAPRTVKRYRKLLDQAESYLSLRFSAEECAAVLSEMRVYTSLQGSIGNIQGLCFFSSKDFKGFFPIDKSEHEIQDACVVGDTFHLTPIAEFVNPMRSWHLAKLTKGGINFYRGRGPALEFAQKIEFKDHPRTKTASGEPTRFIRFALDDHAALDGFLDEMIDEASKRFPLVLCGTKTDTDGYVRDSLHSFDHVINFSERYRELEEAALLNAVWPQLAEHFQQDRKMALAGLIHACKSGLSTCDPRQILERINAGRLKLMAVSIGKLQWSVSNDLLQRAIIQGCKVFVCDPNELPGGMAFLAV